MQGFSACGLRLQVRDRIFGRLTGNPRDPDEMVETLDDMLRTPMQRELHGGKDQRRVYDRLLMFTPLASWMRRLAEVPPPSPVARR